MVGSVTTQQHIGAMLWTSGPAIGGARRVRPHRPDDAGVGSAFDPTVVQASLAAEFNISLLNLLPLVLLVVLSIRQAPPFLAIFGCALFAGVLAIFTQPAVGAFVNRPELGRSPPRSRRSTPRWPPGSSRRPATRRSTRCSRAAGWRRC